MAQSPALAHKAIPAHKGPAQKPESHLLAAAALLTAAAWKSLPPANPQLPPRAPGPGPHPGPRNHPARDRAKPRPPPSPRQRREAEADNVAWLRPCDDSNQPATPDKAGRRSKELRGRRLFPFTENA